MRKYVPMSVVLAHMSDPGWGGFLFQLAMMAHCFPLTQKAQIQKQRWNELKSTGQWPPPMNAALLPYLTRNHENNSIGPPDVHTHPNCEEIVALIYDAIAEEHPFDHEYIWDEVDSDYCFS